MARIRITVDGKPALTTRMLAEELGIDLASTRKAIQRLGLEAVDHLDERTPLYEAAPTRKAMRDRPGRGASGQPRAPRVKPDAAPEAPH